MSEPLVSALTISLTSLGLTKYESVAYISLMNEGTCSAREISSICGMPYGKTYEVIRNLERKGFAEMIPTKPLRCAAVEPEHAFKQIRERFISNIQKAEDDAKKIVRGRRLPKEKHMFLMARGRSLINTKIERMITNARKNIFICGTPNSLERLKYFNESLRLKTKNGIRVLIIRNNDCITNLISTDGKEALLFEPIPDNCEFGYGADRGIFISDKSSTHFLDMLLLSYSQRDALTKTVQ
jgi:sugar-specific transcriptional regulator TrmB